MGARRRSRHHGTGLAPPTKRAATSIGRPATNLGSVTSLPGSMKFASEPLVPHPPVACLACAEARRPIPHPCHDLGNLDSYFFKAHSCCDFNHYRLPLGG